MGLIVLAPNGRTLGVVATNSLYEDFETYGRAPDRNSLSVRLLGPNDSYGWVAHFREDHSGEEARWSTVYGVMGNSVKPLATFISHHHNPMACQDEGSKVCTNLFSTMQFDKSASGHRFYPIKLRAHGNKKGRPFDRRYRAVFHET